MHTTYDLWFTQAALGLVVIAALRAIVWLDDRQYRIARLRMARIRRACAGYN